MAIEKKTKNKQANFFLDTFNAKWKEVIFNIIDVTIFNLYSNVSLC